MRRSLDAYLPRQLCNTRKSQDRLRNREGIGSDLHIAGEIKDQSSDVLNYLNRDDTDDPLIGELGCDGISM